MSCFPYLNFIAFYALRVLMRFLDSGWRCCLRKHDTKKTTIQQYIDLYAGPEMLMHFKYSNVMNLVFVAFLHGVAMPILFPIAFFGVFNNFLCERLLLAWYYK